MQLSWPNNMSAVLFKHVVHVFEVENDNNNEIGKTWLHSFEKKSM